MDLTIVEDLKIVTEQSSATHALSIAGSVAEIESLYIIASLADIGNKIEDVKALTRKYT